MAGLQAQITEYLEYATNPGKQGTHDVIVHGYGAEPGRP